MYVSTPCELAAFCDRARHSKVLAVDTEFLREKTYFPKLCLVQVAAGDDIAAIDPILIKDLSPLARLFEDKGTTKVFHASSQDLEVLFDGMGCMCSPVFDTQVAAAFLGLRQQVSYATLVEAYTGVRLPKAESLTDWSKRPLDPDQLTYAEDDVRYLPEIYSRMVAELGQKGRLSWVEPEMAEICNPARIKRDPREAYLKLRRASALTRRQLAIAREVCAWREATAAKHDIPRKWVVSDEVIVEICKRVPTSTDRLRKIRGTDQISARDVSDLVCAVRRGCDCEDALCPKAVRASRPSPETEGIVDLMYAVLRLVSEESGVAAQVIATRDDLLAFLGDRTHSRLSSGWRYELAGSKLADLLSGEVGLTVRDGHIELL